MRDIIRNDLQAVIGPEPQSQAPAAPEQLLAPALP